MLKDSQNKESNIMILFLQTGLHQMELSSTSF